MEGDLRTLIRARQAFARQSRETYDRILGAGIGAARRSIEVRCGSHTGGKAPKLAEAAIVEGHLLFTSRLHDVGGDRHRLPPWTIEHLLGAGMPEDTLVAMGDDALLTYAASLTQPRDGDQNWWGISRQHPSWLQYAVPLGRPAPPVGLWVRCGDHPGEARRVEPQEFLSARP